MEAWARREGAEGLVAIRHGAHGTEGVALAAAHVGQSLLRLPAPLLLDPAAAAAHAIVGPALRKAGLLAHGLLFGAQGGAERQAWAVVLLLAVLEASRRAGDEGPWDPYLAALPHNPALGKAEARRLLGDAHPLTRRAEERHARVDAFCTRVDTEALGVERELVHWAHQVFFSRALAVPVNSEGKAVETAALVPFLDALNHRPGTLHRLRAAGAAVELEAGAPVAADEPVCINYGAKANAELLLHYGFCLAENPADHVTVRLAGSEEAFVFYLQQDGFPEGLLDAARRPWRSDATTAAAGEIDWTDPASYLHDAALGTPLPDAAQEADALSGLAQQLTEQATALAARAQVARQDDSSPKAGMAAILLDGEAACLRRLIENLDRHRGVQSVESQ